MPSQDLYTSSLSQRILSHLGSRQVWNKELFFFALLLYALTSLAFDSVRAESFEYLWPVIWIDTFVITVGVAVALYWVIPKRFWGSTPKGLATNLIITALLGAAKNSAVYLWASEWGLDSTGWDPVVRLVGGAFMGAGIFAIGGSLTASRIGHKQAMAQLLERQEELRELQSRISSVAAETQSQLVRQARASLLPQIESLKASLQGSISGRDISSSLSILIEKYVRPLSKGLSKDAEKIQAKSPAERQAIKISPLPRRFEFAASIKPLPILLIVMPAQYLLFRGNAQPPSLSELLTGAGLAALSLFIVRELWPKTLRPRRAAGIIALIVMSVVVSVPEYLYFDRLLPDQTFRSFNLYTIAIIVFLTTGTITWMNLMDHSRLKIREDLIRVNERINHELALFEQRVWLQKRRWSYLLHGNVQAKLTAAGLKASAAAGKGKKTSEQVVRDVHEVLDQIVNVVAEANDQEINVRNELENLVTTWKGIMTVQLDITAPAWKVLESDQNAAMALNEISREVSNNAVRHGGASELKIEVVKPSDGQLRIRAINNGTYPKSKAKGLGLQMFDALTTDWAFSRDAKGLVILTATLPVSLD